MIQPEHTKEFGHNTQRPQRNMVTILVPKTLGRRFKAACEALGIAPKAMLSYLVTKHLSVLDEDSADYVRGFEQRMQIEGTEELSVLKRPFAKLRSLGYRLETAAMYVAAALIWEHLDVLENSPEAYGDIPRLRNRLSPRKYTTGIYCSIYRQIVHLAIEAEAPSVRGLVYRIFCSLDLDDVMASLSTEDLLLFKRRYAGDKIYPVHLPYPMYQVLQGLKREKCLPHVLVASVILQHEIDALRTKVLGDALDTGQSTLERWMLVLESVLVPELDE